MLDGAPIFEPEVFRKEIHCVEESSCEIVKTFRCPQQTFCAPIMIRRLGNLPPVVTPYPGAEVRICKGGSFAFFENGSVE